MTELSKNYAERKEYYALYEGPLLGYYIFPGCYLPLKDCGKNLKPQKFATRKEAIAMTKTVWGTDRRRVSVVGYPELPK